MEVFLLTKTHAMVRTLSNSENMRRNFISPLSSVNTNCSHGVDGESLVRVDSNTEETGVSVDQSLNIAHLQVEQD